MRLRIEATPAELADKSEALVKALAEALAPVAPDLAERLEKAAPKDAPKLLQPALRQIHEITRKEYDKRIKWMLKDIGKVLDQSLAKAEEPEKLEPGDIDPETGEEVPEEKEEEEEEETEEETE